MMLLTLIISLVIAAQGEQWYLPQNDIVDNTNFNRIEWAADYVAAPMSAAVATKMEDIKSEDYYRIIKPKLKFTYADYNPWCRSIANGHIKNSLLLEVITDNKTEPVPTPAKTDCEKDEYYHNPICIHYRAKTIGDLIKQDADRLADSSEEEQRLLYKMWETHPYVRELCPNQYTFDYKQYLEGLSRLENSKLTPYAKVLLYAENLLKKTTELCLSKQKSYDMFCSLETIRYFVELENKLFSNRNSFLIEIYKDAARLQFLTLKKNSPGEYNKVRTEEALPLITRNTKVILYYMVRDEIKDLFVYAAYLPPLDFYKCGMVCNSREIFCTFMKVIAQTLITLRQQFRQDNFARKDRFKFIQSSVDHRELLHQNILTRILGVLSSQVKTSTAIARYTIEVFKKELKEEIAKLKDAIIKNTHDRFSELKKYFQSMHAFDTKIAQGDLKLILKNVRSLENTLIKDSNQVNDEVNDILKTTLNIMRGEVLYRNSRIFVGFFATIFKGFNIDQTSDNIEELLRASKGLNRATKLRTILPKIKIKTKGIDDHLKKNDKMLNIMRDILDKVNATSDLQDPQKLPNFSEYRKDFLKLYNEYQPTLGTSDIVELGSYWRELVEEACEIMKGESHISPPSKIIGYCVTSKVAIDKLAETYEEIYDFQFEMLDALALYMRSVSGIQAAESINTQYAVYTPNIKIDENKLDYFNAVADCSLITYMVQVYVSVKAYCAVLQYKNGGVKPNACQGFQTNVPWLTSLTISPCNDRYHMILNTLPTKPSYAGDTAFVDLAKLYQGVPVTFKVPNSQWLVDAGWIEKREKNHAFYVEQFEVYLPSQFGNETFRVSVEAQTDGASIITQDGDKFLIDQNEPLNFAYTKGPLNYCRQRSFPDPYKICRNTQISFDEICPMTVTKTDDTRLYPGIHSKWVITVNGFEKQSIPKVASDLSLAIGLKICSKSPQQSISKRVRRKAMLRKRANIRNCCTDKGQFYWNMKKKTCVMCPNETKSALDGYYCSQ